MLKMATILYETRTKWDIRIFFTSLVVGVFLLGFCGDRGRVNTSPVSRKRVQLMC